MALKPCIGCGRLTRESRCAECARARHGARYGNAHQQLRQQWAPIVATGAIVCSRGCGRLIAPGEAWDLDHSDDDPTAYLGPSHARCNRGARP